MGKRLLLGIILIFLSGCSVLMAASGEREPDMSVVRVGATRAEVELQLGEPVATKKYKNGTLEKYEFEFGDEPSAGRAVANGALDLLTIGAWELIATPLEAFRGDGKQITVLYDYNDTVVGLKNSKD